MCSMHIVSFSIITEYVSLDSIAPTDHLVVKMKYCYSSFISMECRCGQKSEFYIIYSYNMYILLYAAIASY